MKLLTVSLCVCAMMALTQASAIRQVRSACDAKPPEEPLPPVPPTMVLPKPDEPPMTTLPPTFPPTTTTPPFGGWVPSCPGGNWRMFDIRCLLYVPKKMTWSDAKMNCGGNGLTPALDDWHSGEIVTLLKEVGHSGQVWVGGCSTDNDGWDSSTYSYWKDETPDCIQAESGEISSCLNSTRCEPELPSICSYTIM